MRMQFRTLLQQFVIAVARCGSIWLFSSIFAILDSVRRTSAGVESLIFKYTHLDTKRAHRLPHAPR